MIFFFFLLVDFFIVSLLSCIFVNEDATFLGGVIPMWIPYIVHILNVIKLFGIGKRLLYLVYCSYGVVRSSLLALIPMPMVVLPVRVVPIILIQEPFSSLLFYSNHPLYRVLEVFICLHVLSIEIMKLSLG